MQITLRSHSGAIGPKRHSYNENVDEPAKLIEDESVEIEREAPAGKNEPIEGTEENGKPDAPVFEE